MTDAEHNFGLLLLPDINDISDAERPQDLEEGFIDLLFHGLFLVLGETFCCSSPCGTENSWSAPSVKSNDAVQGKVHLIRLSERHLTSGCVNRCERIGRNVGHGRYIAFSLDASRCLGLPTVVSYGRKQHTKGHLFVSPMHLKMRLLPTCFQRQGMPLFPAIPVVCSQVRNLPWHHCQPSLAGNFFVVPLQLRNTDLMATLCIRYDLEDRQS